MARLEVIGVEGIGEVQPGDDLASLIIDAVAQSDTGLCDGDVLVVTPEDRLEGRELPGAHRRVRPRVPQGSGRAGVGAHPSPTRRAHHLPRPATASSVPTRASICRTSSAVLPPCCPKTPTAPLGASETPSGAAPVMRWRSSCRIHSAGRGVVGSPMSPSVLRASRPYSISGARPMPSAGRCR